MSTDLDLTGITNQNEYYTNHYFSTLFQEDAGETIRAWRTEAGEEEGKRTPWAMLRGNARLFYAAHDRCLRSGASLQTLADIRGLADSYLLSLGYPAPNPVTVDVDNGTPVPVYLEMNRSNGAPLLWVLLSASPETDAGIMESFIFDSASLPEETAGALDPSLLCPIANEDLVTKIFFAAAEPPRFLLLVGMEQIALVDRNKWNEKRYLQFELEEIFSRPGNTTLQAMAVLLHRDPLCPEEGTPLPDTLDGQSRRHASGVSQDLKYALRESIELLGNEVLYDRRTRLGEEDDVDAGELTVECLRYMYRMLFVLFIEARPELGYAPIRAQSYYATYSLESLRDIADSVRADIDEVGEGYYLCETISKLFDLIYDGYPGTEEKFKEVSESVSLHDMFIIAPLKAHIFDPEYTPLLTGARLRNRCMLQIIDRMSLTRSSGRRNDRRGRISYANLGINQLGAVYEALLSYRGFIAEEDLYEVKRAGDSFNELDVGYFVKGEDLEQYEEDERVRYESGEKKGQLRLYPKGSFIYRLAGREREKSASYYTPESLTKCLVKYALQELLEGKSAEEILHLTVCEPAMGSAAFLNEAINQLAEAYISRREKETGETISYENRFDELQKVKMYIADHNVYGVDLNPVAVELAEVSLWLNTIYPGGYVPWFGNQLVNGNSLIGARRQVYRVDSAQTSTKGLRWYETEPEDLPLGTARTGKEKSRGKKQFYHFLLGDPGMASYSDKVIKSLAPEQIKQLAAWNKDFTRPVTDDEAESLLRLSAVIDGLWETQVKLRQEVRDRTWDNMSIFGHRDDVEDSHTTIREKDRIYHELYKSENMRNAGPYARLKFAMDYWCALWFWPIDQADLLPSRSEFLFEMSLILEGTTEAVLVTDVATEKKQIRGQTTLFPTEMQQKEEEFLKLYGTDGITDIPALRKGQPRLDLVARIAEENHFMHWELEFAEVFAERGGFDLIVGNPPWIKLSWNEQDVLSDKNPVFAIKNLSASQTAQRRTEALTDEETKKLYFNEYISISGQQNFLSAVQNYNVLSGMKTNLFKCFLPQAWHFGGKAGVSAFVHPEGVYDDPKGGALRERLYPRLRRHFQFTNERKLFSEVDHHTQFSLNVYGGAQKPSFDSISNLFDPASVEACYEGDKKAPVPGVKDEDGSWNTAGHPDRVIHVSRRELAVFAKLFDGSDNWRQARLPVIHTRELMQVLGYFAAQKTTLASMGDRVFTTQMWNETNAQKDGTIKAKVSIPGSPNETIYAGAHINIANPYYQTTRRIYRVNSDYDRLELTDLPEYYLIRTKYVPDCSMEEYYRRTPTSDWGKVTQDYRIMNREMVGCSSERTLTAAIAAPGFAHVNTIFGVSFKNRKDMVLFAGLEASLPYDFLVKTIGKSHVNYSTTMLMPFLTTQYDAAISLRALLLNCLTIYYRDLWSSCWEEDFAKDSWSRPDPRLDNDRFRSLTNEWDWSTPLRTDYERRQALVELDVLTAMALGMTLEQLKTIYRIQFPVLQQYEADTWYDANGRIVFTTNRSLTGVGYDRNTWENQVKGATPGETFTRTITDDTQPGGPVERTITYLAPFDRCDREQDYEKAWAFFEKKYQNTAETKGRGDEA